ncbi:protein phosphatase 2C 44-like [Tripterygium wilfordii]|uniref:protein-serine/threonine phosphatase n=1 Tax=Tripterygium wilfordii TaxID=458696 RepID=A0A7J7DTQ1_TRIWF|nr:probable protein phosphatase 2C 44 [Tripterygium wilfordii]KAF5749673.1 protein phosphatase 2C 44-like [Tripterygium wilfordii]
MSKHSAPGASRPAPSKPNFLTKIKSASCFNSPSPDCGKGRSKSSGRKTSHGFHLVEGKSGHDMEDYHVAEYRKKKNHELGLFAIFDGHLGDRVPTYLKDNLFNNILDEQNFFKDPAIAIKNAYCSTDKFILENSMQLGPGGSTAVTAIVIDGTDLWVANVGDSRAVAFERGAANQLTVDHEPHSERKRIEKQGGFVTILPGDVPRVNGQLAVARAFGDQSLKAHLSSEPDVRHVPIDPTIEFVILASDGLWKVMKNQEAVDFVKSIRDPQAAAKRLTSEALARKSKDDISCIVIRFG